jgi:hypothetical protein
MESHNNILIMPLWVNLRLKIVMFVSYFQISLSVHLFFVIRLQIKHPLVQPICTDNTSVFFQIKSKVYMKTSKTP